MENKNQLPLNAGEVFEQYGEKGTAIGTASNFAIINAPFPREQKDSEVLSQAINELNTYRKKIELYEELGIIGCTEGLKGTSLVPSECMLNVQKSLFFMGVGGEKWVKDVQLRKYFVNMLLQTKSVGGEVRFLLINPASKAYGTLYRLRGESVPHDSYGFFIEMMRDYENLKVNLYSHMPSFRMQFVDDSYLAISRYYFIKSSHDHWDGGWKIPHLILSAERKNVTTGEIEHRGSLYNSFLLAYNSNWQNGTSILKWDAEGRKYNK